MVVPAALRRRLAAGLVLAAALAGPAAAWAHAGNPHYRSAVRSITPAAAGVSARVLNFDDRIRLVNRSPDTIVVEGYQREPYARLAGDGTVQVNLSSPAYYLNDDRFATAKVPAGVRAADAPRWKTISRTGAFEWHDHRSHYMGRGVPARVTDQDVRTKVFDWTVPIEVDGRAGRIAGDLFWTPLPGGGPPVAAIVAFAAVVAGLLAAVVVVRRRRRGAAGNAGVPREAW